MIALYALLAPLALADTLTLDSGATIEGALVSYDPAGECRVEVAAGALSGTTLLVPCARLLSFERAPRDLEPAVSAAVQEEAVEEEPVEEEPVEEVDLTRAESLEPALPAELAPLEPLAEELEPVPALVPALPPTPPAPPARVPSPERAPTVRAPVNTMTW